MDEPPPRDGALHSPLLFSPVGTTTMAMDFPDAPPAALPQLDGYRFLGVLGQGGMGTVFRAEQEVLGRQVAVKMLHRDLTKKPRQLERFLQEARIVARMGCHAHVVQVHDVVRDAAGAMCIIMEYVEGTSLAGSLRAGERPSLGDAVRIAIQVAEALEVAHARGIVHRDIKPENILLTRDGWVKVTDFGIARSEGANFRTQTGEILGTPHYMAPEQVKGDGSADARADIYALCVVLYYLSVGELPFDDTNPYSIAFKHINSPVPPPRKLLPTIPAPLEALILRGLEKDPDDRFQTATELREALEGLLAACEAGTRSGPRAPVTTLSGVGALPGTPPGGLGLGAAAHEAPTPSARHGVDTPEFRAVIETDPTTGTRYRFELSGRAVAIAATLLVLLLVALFAVARSGAGRATDRPRSPLGAGARVASATSNDLGRRPGGSGPLPGEAGPMPSDGRPMVAPPGEPPAPPVAPSGAADAAASTATAPAPDTRPLLAVLPFAIDAPDLAEGDGARFASLLSRQFSADAYRLIDPAQVARALEIEPAALAPLALDTERAAEAGRRAGLRYVVTGSLSRLGVFVVSAALVDVTSSSIVATASIDAPELGELVSHLHEVAHVLAMSPDERARYRQEMLMSGVVKSASVLYDQMDGAIAPVGAGAFRMLGMAAQAGIGMPRDAGWASTLYRRAAEEGSVAAVDNLVAIAGRPTEADGATEEAATTSRVVVETVGELSHPLALTRLGDRFRDGAGVARDLGRAVECYERAAEGGHAPAMLRLADLFLAGGDGLAASPDLAARWLDRAAAAGDPEAAFRLADQLAASLGASAGADRAAAIDRMAALYRLAAEAGHAPAMRRVAAGTAAPAEAVVWYRRAAEAGDVPSMLLLAQWLAEGRDGVAPDRVMSVVWLRRAASTGDLEAMRRLRLLDAQQAD